MIEVRDHLHATSLCDKVLDYVAERRSCSRASMSGAELARRLFGRKKQNAMMCW